MDCPFYLLDEYFSHTIATYPFYEWWSVDLKMNVISHRECNTGGKKSMGVRTEVIFLDSKRSQLVRWTQLFNSLSDKWGFFFSLIISSLRYTPLETTGLICGKIILLQHYISARMTLTWQPSANPQLSEFYIALSIEVSSTSWSVTLERDVCFISELQPKICCHSKMPSVKTITPNRRTCSSSSYDWNVCSKKKKKALSLVWSSCFGCNRQKCINRMVVFEKLYTQVVNQSIFSTSVVQCVVW